MRRWIKRALIGMGIAVLGLVAFFVVKPGILLEIVVFYGDLFSGSEVYESGAAYGVTIGQTKDESIVSLYDHFADQKIYLGICNYIDERECPTLYRIVAFPDFTDKDMWHLSFIYGCCDNLKLYFEDGKLIKIRRYWSPGSIP